jgi:hypothetical protein
MSDDDTLITVATFDNLMEAELARGYLEREGLRCCLADAELVNTNWYLSAAMGGIKLQVARADFLTAERLMHSRPKFRADDCDDYGLKPSSNQITEQPGKVRQPNEGEDDQEFSENPAETPAKGPLRVVILGLFLVVSLAVGAVALQFFMSVLGRR